MFSQKVLIQNCSEIFLNYTIYASKYINSLVHNFLLLKMFK